MSTPSSSNLSLDWASLCCCRGYSLGSPGRAEAALRQPPDENPATPDPQQIAPKRGVHEVASTENPASRLLLGAKAGNYRCRERLLQYVLAVRAACPSRRSMAWRKDARRFPPIWKAMSEPTSRPKAPPSKTPSTKKRFRNDNIGVTCSCLTTACTLLPERRSTTV